MRGEFRRTVRVGDKRGKLTVIAIKVAGTTKHPRHRVRCECGKEYEISQSTLAKVLGCRECRRGGKDTKYGDDTIVGLPLYRSWVSMRRRCRPNTDDPRTARWAGRGIKVCDEWESFEAFRDWSLAHGYAVGLSLDRIDNDGDYTPENCEWVTRSENSKRARALYHYVPKAKAAPSGYPLYDEPWFGDF